MKKKESLNKAVRKKNFKCWIYCKGGVVKYIK